MQEKEDVSASSSSSSWQKQKLMRKRMVKCSSMVIIMAVMVLLVGIWKESRDAKCSFLFHQLDSFKGILKVRGNIHELTCEELSQRMLYLYEECGNSFR
ncbi:hypothetical protein YC2023_066646 [Brassica napus]